MTAPSPGSDREETVAIQAGGGCFHARRRGAGAWTVFVHGLAGDLHGWDGLWQALGEGRSLLRYDLRGHGQTTADPEIPYDHAQDLAAVLDSLGIETFDLIGISMGGAVALNFTLDHPERVRKLVLISPAIVAWEWSDEWRERWQRSTSRARQGDLGAARRMWWEHPLFDTVRDSEAGPEMLASIERFPGGPWITDPHRPMLPDIERLHLLHTPTLLLTGGQDLTDFRLVADLIEAASDSVTRIVLPDNGHMLHLESPERTHREIAAFLAGA